ncbi:helix-turn-helix transcriptional regulator [Corynebacterium sp.]|uniref:helix-turn-helix transcriptional regulator n=1 Tax=Corynebacterium sp. TaxID=1720 RepID=UPI003B3B15DE
MTNIIGRLRLVDDDGWEFWTTAQCAEYLGISPSTWSAYTTRKQAPATVGRFDRLKVWKADEVRDWHAGRRSQRNE